MKARSRIRERAIRLTAKSEFITANTCNYAKQSKIFSNEYMGLAAAQVVVVIVHRLEAGTSEPRHASLQAIPPLSKTGGIEFIDENGGGPGVRLRKRHQKKA
jgi:hypothetical protein